MKKNQRKGSKDFKAVLTMDQINAFEQNIRNVNARRRMAMITLARSRDDLVKGFKGDPKTFLYLFEEVSTYVEHMEGGLELARCAQARLLSVGEMFVK